MASILLCTSMIIGLIPEGTLTVFADPIETSGNWTDYAAESVTAQGNVYMISTAEDLAWLANTMNATAVNDNELNQGSITYKLVDDIDLSEHYWKPIGNDFQHRFMGIFDGNGHTISGMHVGTPESPNAGTDSGLFGIVAGSVRNLKITDSAVYAQMPNGNYLADAGLIAGRTSGANAIVKNCDVSGTVGNAGSTGQTNEIATKKRNASSGGIVGDFQQGTAEACRVNVSLVALDSPSDHYYSFGGIAGTVANASDATVINCVSNMTLSLPDGMDLGRVGAGAPFSTGKQCALKNSIVRADLGGALGFLGSISSRRSTCWIETNFKAESDGNYVLQSPKYTYYGTLTDSPAEMTEEQMKDPSFVTTLNTKASNMIGLSDPLTWSIDENENDGFPNLADAGITESEATYWTVTFMSGGSIYQTVSVESGKSVSRPSAPPAPSEDASFLYWYKDDPSAAYDFSKPVTSDITLTAKWKGQDFTVRFDTRGGSYVYPLTVENGETATEPFTQKKGYTLVGWYTDSSCTAQWDFSTPVTSDMTLYAKWTKASDISISGRITDAGTGEGIRNAAVKIMPSGLNAMTDEFGYYRIYDVTSGTYTITAEAYGYYGDSSENFTVGNTPAGYDAALTPKTGGGGGAATVNVYATVSCVYSGIMLDGVEIKAVGEGNLGTYTETTGNGGQATFVGIPAGTYTFHINETGRPGWESYVSPQKVLDSDNQLNCALKPNYQTLKVNVIGTFDPKTNTANAPLKGKEVTLIGVDPKDEEKELINIPAHTGDDGSVTVQKLVPITWKISCSDFAYEMDEVTVTSDGAGKLSEDEVTLTLPFIDSSLSVNLTSVYEDEDIFKRTEENKDSLPDVLLSGVAGTTTEGIVRSGRPDASGKVVFTGLFPGNYNLSADGKVKRVVDIKSDADRLEIFGNPNDGDFSRFGRKHFDVDFHGKGSGSVALGMRSDATLEMDPSPVSFSGILYKTDMDDNGEITSEPLKNAKLFIKPSAYYPQSGVDEEGYEITTDSNGHYSITMAPGLYGVEMESTYDGYFGGKLTWHEGNSDGYAGPWGWPCTGKWKGTKASAVAWMTGDETLAYGDIGGMSLSSGTAVADLEIMEKKINYSACSPGSPVLYGNKESQSLIIGCERDEEITHEDRSTVMNNYDYYNNTYSTVNFRPDTRGATLKLTGDKKETVLMTGKSFPYVFTELSPGNYGLEYTLSDEFSHLKPSVYWRENITFFDFPAPGKLPDSFPEDYADQENPNPWPLSTVGSLFKIEAKTGNKTFQDIHDSIGFKFWDLNYYDKTGTQKPRDPEIAVNNSNTGSWKGIPQSKWEEVQAEYAERDLHWRWDNGELGEDLSEAVYNDSNMPTENQYYHLVYNDEVVPRPGYGSEVFKPDACSYPAEPEIPPKQEGMSQEDYDSMVGDIMWRYTQKVNAFNDAYAAAVNKYKEDYAAWYQTAYVNAGFPKAGALYCAPEGDGSFPEGYENASNYIFETYLVAYSTSKIPDKLFYYHYSNTNRSKPLPDGEVKLYFCAPKGKGHVFLNNLQYVRHRENLENLYDSDLWFSVTIDKNSETTRCDVDFLHEGAANRSSSNVTIYTPEQIKNLLNPRTIVVKAIESGNPDHVLNDVAVTITYAGREFSSAQSAAQQTCTGSVTEVKVPDTEYEWECRNISQVVSVYDDANKTQTFYVPFTRVSYSKEFQIRDDAGNPIQGASITLIGKSVGQPLTVFTGADGKATVYDRLTYQDYDVNVTSPGYMFHNFTLTAEDVRSDDTKTDSLTRNQQPEFDEEGVSINRKGAFIPGINFAGSSNSIDFLVDAAITDAKDKPLYYTVNAKLKTAPGDSLLEILLIDKKTFKNADFGDVPEALATPAMDENNYNPSQAWQWGEKLEKGELGNVYYRRLSGGESFVPAEEKESWKYYEIEKTLPLWELPPDGFEPCLLAVTSDHAMQIYDFDYSGEAEADQLVGIRISGERAAVLKSITLMANAQALGGPAVEKLAEISEPTGTIIPLPSFEAGIEEEDGFLSYDYTLEMELLSGKKSVSDAEKSYMAILPSTLGIMAKGGYKMGLDGEERKLTGSFSVTVAGKDMDALDYLPSAFEALPVKVEFDEDNPPQGTITLASADTKDKHNNNTEEEYSLGVNGQVHVIAEVSAFSSFAAVLPVGPVLASLEKSGALDIGAKVQVAVGADGTYKYKIINGEEVDSEHEIEFTLGAGAGLGFYAKAFGGALGAEANLKLTGDNDKLPDMVTVSASIGTEDGFKLNRIDGKVQADAHIEMKTWLINGEKDFKFVEIPFSYQFGTETYFSLTRIDVVDNMRSRNDFDRSTYNGSPDTVVSNLLPIGGYAVDENYSGSFVYTDMSAKGGNVQLKFANYDGNRRWNSPVIITSTSGLIPAYDVISLPDGEYLVVWSEIEAGNMMMTCPPSQIRYSVGKYSGTRWTGNVKTLTSFGQAVASELHLVSDDSGIFLAALKTAEGPLAEKYSISCFRYNDGWSAETVLAQDQRAYGISACAAGGGLFVSFVTDDMKLHALKWKNAVSGSVYDATGFETSMAADDENAYILYETAEGLTMRRYTNGAWTDGEVIDSTASPANPSLTVTDRTITAVFTGATGKDLYMTVCGKDGGILEDRKTLKELDPESSVRFDGITASAVAGDVIVFTVANGEQDNLNIYSDKVSDKEPAVIKNNPEPIGGGLTYCGYDMELVTAGTVEGGTMYYAVTEKGAPEPDPDSYRRNIPKKKEAGEYNVYYRIQADASHSATHAVTAPHVVVEIKKAEITPAMISLPATEVEGGIPNGGLLCPDPVITFMGSPLVKGRDFTFENIRTGSFGKRTVTVKGIGNFSGSPQAVWDVIQVAPKEEGGEFSHSVIEAQIYTGFPIAPEPRILWNGRELTKDTDYSLAYSNNTKVASKNAGKNAPTVTVKGKGQYKSNLTIPFDIVERSIGDGYYLSGGFSAQIEDMQATGKSVLSKPVIRYTDDATGKTVTLKEKTDYTLGYDPADPTKPGRVTVTVSGINNYKGKAKLFYNIVGKSEDLKKAVVLPIADQTYTGDAFTQDEIDALVTVKASNDKNAETVDKSWYTVSYDPAATLKAGKVTLTVRGTDGHGELWKTASFKIVPKPVGGDAAAPAVIRFTDGDEKVYTGEAIKPEIQVYDPDTGRLIPASDYTVKYANNVNVENKTATVATVAFKGNYKGTVTAEFAIVPKPVDPEDISVFQADMKYAGKAIDETALKPTVKLGKITLKKDKDYTIAPFVRDPDKDMQTATVILTGNYSGEYKYMFRIYGQNSALDLSDTDIFDVQLTGGSIYTFNGGKITPDVKVTAAVDGRVETLVADRDYKITFSNNVDAARSDAGKKAPSWKIAGKGAYKGNRTGTFTIAAKKLSESTCTFTVTDCKYNNGKPVTPKVTVTDRAIGKVLKAGKDYKLVFRNNSSAAEADAGNAPAVIIEGIGNYSTVGAGDPESADKDAVKKTFRIYLNDISGVKVEGLDAMDYTGSQIRPAGFTVRDPKNKAHPDLVKDVDYTVEYGENVNVGNGTVTIRGMGDYGNAKTFKFKIVPRVMK